MERYANGQANGLLNRSRESGLWVRIPPSPPDVQVRTQVKQGVLR